MDLKIHVVGLAISCPMTSSVDDCPFKRYRNQPLEQITKTINEIAYDELISLSKHHKKCLSDRIQSLSRQKEIDSSKVKSKSGESLPYYHFLAF